MRLLFDIEAIHLTFPAFRSPLLPRLKQSLLRLKLRHQQILSRLLKSPPRILKLPPKLRRRQRLLRRHQQRRHRRRPRSSRSEMFFLALLCPTTAARTSKSDRSPRRRVLFCSSSPRLTPVSNVAGYSIQLLMKIISAGCTTQACGFRDVYQDFTGLDYVVYCVSADSTKVQTSWKNKARTCSISAKRITYLLVVHSKRCLILCSLTPSAH